jgi:hypothetical protein
MSVGVNRVRRVSGVTGILFVIAGVVAFILPGLPPKADEVAKIGTYFTGKRSELLAGNFVLGVAFVLFLIFAGALRAYLSAGDREGLRPGAAMVSGAGAATALTLAGAAVINGAVFQVAAAGDAHLNQALYDIGNDLLIISGFAFAAFFIGSAVAIAFSGGALPRVLVPAAGVVALLNVVGGIGLFAKSGFFAIGGAYSFIVPAVSLLWVLVVSVALLARRAPAASAGAT